MRRKDLIILAVAVSFAVVLAISQLAQAVIPTASWGLSFQQEGQTPIGPAAVDTLKNYDAAYVGNTKEKVLYLTFDAGYENGNVAKVLDALAAEGATGAFFILGHLAEGHPALLRRMADEGHLVCNHTYTHRNLCGASAEAVQAELSRLEDVCREKAGVTVAKYFRPPEGSFDGALLAEVQRLGYKTVFWSFAYADWDNQRQPDPASAKKKILDNVHNGAVILLHPTSATNAAILPDLLRALKAEGYRFGSLDELTGGD